MKPYLLWCLCLHLFVQADLIKRLYEGKMKDYVKCLKVLTNVCVCVCVC